MKKLFRTSKSTVDPLPPPPPPSAAPLVTNSQHQQHPHAREREHHPSHTPTEQRSPVMQPANMKKSLQSLMMGTTSNNDHHGDYNSGSKGWGFGGGGGEKEKVTPFPLDLGRDREPSGQPPPPPSKKKDKHGSGGTKVPTLLDMQHQQMAAGTGPNSAGDWRNSNGYYESTTPNSNYPYLPPGARPPSPPAPLRPGTPTRNPYSNAPLQGSQTSMHHPDDSTPRMPAGRDRGYSSASEQESVPLPKMYPVKSPLAFPDQGNMDTRPPPPLHPPPPHLTPQTHQHAAYQPSPIQAHYPPPNDDNQRSFMPEEPKERKKFWGVAWGEKKDKDKDRERERERDRHKPSDRDLARPPTDDKRPSFETWREPSESLGHGSSGHHSQGGHQAQGRPQQLQPPLAGTAYEGYTAIDSAENVNQAIDMLVAFPDPPMSAIYAICDRVFQSQTPESICKEAAKALRKHFKHGNENERRSTAKLWLIMMRNIGNDAFRHYAGNRKFISPLETILLASPNKPVVSPSTYRLLTEVLADLTFMYGSEKGCEGLIDLWKKVKLPQEPDRGIALSPKHPLFAADELTQPPSTQFSQANSRRGSEPMVGTRAASPDNRHGPAYAALPNHSDDIRRLHEESIAAKESARVLTEALVFTRPEDLSSKPIINEFYRKCFMAHESLTNQMDWAQAEASRSREAANVHRLMTTDHEQDVNTQTMEEEALGTLFEAHSSLAEAIRQHDELERMAQDEQELRQVRERSRKDTRMDRNELLAPQTRPQGSGSRSPSPAPHGRLPPVHLADSDGLPEPRYPQDRSRTPSPDHFAPPKMSTSPGRASSPLGRAKGPRPLPNPLRSVNGSNPALNPGTPAELAVSATELDPNQPVQPSRKALGKRRAIVDPDNDFDPDDMFNGNAGSKKDSSDSSEESLMADEVYTSKPITYAYDAYQEKLDRQKLEGSAPKGETSHTVPPRPRPGTEAFRA